MDNTDAIFSIKSTNVGELWVKIQLIIRVVIAVPITDQRTGLDCSRINASYHESHDHLPFW